MRGKALCLKGSRLDAGITPAYAGKRISCSSICPPGRDHPRVCGEKTDLTFALIRVKGSPPRMRGKELSSIVKLPPHRITPAYAGKRSEAELASEGIKDHPRVCGEKITA